MSFEKLQDVGGGGGHIRIPQIKPDPDAPTLPVMSSSAPALSPWSSFYMSQGFQSFPFPSPNTSYTMAMGMGMSTSGESSMAIPGLWVDYSQYPGFGTSPGPQSFSGGGGEGGEGGTFTLDTPNQHSIHTQSQDLINSIPPDTTSSSSDETSSSQISANLLFQTPSRSISTGPPLDATSYFQSIPLTTTKSMDYSSISSSHEQQQHARAPEPILRQLYQSDRTGQSPFSRSPSPTHSISPVLRRSSNNHHHHHRQQKPSNVPYPRDSIDSTTSIIIQDNGTTRSTAPSIHSSDGLDEDEGMYGEGDDVSNEHDLESEGMERNGMMWGMKTKEYKSLSARERKRVRNRISARTFRARRKEHLSSLESTLSDKDHMIRRLEEENTELRQRLSKYEKAFSRNGLAKCC